MKKEEVKVGEVYLVKVSNRLVPVMLDENYVLGGWLGTNLVTNKRVRIRSAAKLRRHLQAGEVENTLSARNSANGATNTAEANAATTAIERATCASVAACCATREATQDATGPEVTTTKKKMSLLDAAYLVLKELDGEALGCKEIVTRAIARGLWNAGRGKTPASSLNAAIQREITALGDESRFTKSARGRFKCVAQV